MKKIIPILLILLIVLSSSMVFANSNPNTNFNSKKLRDLDPSQWYYDDVMQMINYQIITGYSDDTFRPNENVLRNEYAAMLVRSLKIPINENAHSSFIDLENNDWETKYVESAKYYLTGYKGPNGNLFKPKDNTLREDIMVALVKALNYDISSTNLEILNDYEDKNEISENLLAYVATAIDKGIIRGYVEKEKKYIKPQKAITRAETAKLLLTVIQYEKITFDELEKITFDETPETNNDQAVRIYVHYIDNGIKIYWNELDNSNIKGYKVVATENKNNPTYPEDGYYKFITDSDYVEIFSNSDYYNGGIDSLEENTYYYFNVNTLYNDNTVKLSNTIRIKMPSVTTNDYPITLEGTDDGQFTLNWDKYMGSNFKGYKVVASINNYSPKYPENGYYKYITNNDTNSVTINIGDNYNGNEISSFIANQEYNFSITVLKNDGSEKTYSNTIELEVEEDDIIIGNPIILKGTDNGQFILNWDKYIGSNFSGYKVVASINDYSPKYPENGYYKYITNNDTNSVTINIGDNYNGNEISSFIANQEYNFSITVLKNDGSEKTYSNTI
ncbi:MAG: S-layer homology domain-containing protein [Bacillota bacterium]|nr:S-layer homology domain-containing protein [Bacillota bacterium]